MSAWSFHRWRTVLLLIPAVTLYTIVLGTFSVASSVVGDRGLVAHRCARLWAWLILATTGVEVEVEGLERLSRRRAYLFVANHQSFYDIPVLFAALPFQLRILAKHTLGWVPFLGWHLRRTGHVLVDRGKAGAAVLGRVAARLADEVSLVVFPEGTRSPDGRVGPFKGGIFLLAIRAGRPIVPVTIVGTRRIMAKGKLTARPGRVRLIVHDPIDPAGFNEAEAKTLAERVRAVVAEPLGRAAGTAVRAIPRGPRAVAGVIMAALAGLLIGTSRTPGLESRGSAQPADRVAAIHARTPFADLHAHPSRFHRANVPRILPDELARYRAGLIDVVVANISTDAIYSGNFVLPDGTEVPPRQYRPKPGEAYRFTLERLDRTLATVAAGDACLATDPASVFEARRRGTVALLAALEGADGLEGRLEYLRDLVRRGVRLVQLVHFRPNELGHIQTYPYSPGGLTPFGVQVVREANRLGVIVDLAHANTETIRDAVRVSRAPVVFSHTGVKALYDGDRYLTDEEIRAIARTGGVVGIWPNGECCPEMSDLVGHIEYVRALVGVDHVGIGSDLRGMSRYTRGFGEEANFRAIAEALLAAGYTDEEVGKVMGGNFLRVWTRVMAVARGSR